MSASSPAVRRSLWIPWAFAGAMGLVVLVNAVLVVASLQSFSGVDLARPYERGRGYEDVLAEAARQDSLGLKARVTVEGRLLSVVVRDRNDHPVEGRLEGVLRRPAERGDAPLVPVALAPGTWTAPIEARPGQWEARLALALPDGHVFEIRQRIVLPP